ncbi:MAG: maleylpyruvate isomerase family mycothiol-dependent enzyme [Acidimicrobiales bacterium]
MAQWNLAAKARNDFADMIEALSAEQLDEQSLCGAWTAHGVLCHLTSFVETGGFGLFTAIAKAGFDFDKASVAMVDKRIGRSTADLTASLRANATKSAPLPTFPEELTVADVAIHTQDIRRPLELDGALDDTVLRTSLDFLTTHRHATTLVKRPPLEGLHLKATDMDWSFGDGKEITGTAEALLMGLAVRPVLDELSGDGVANWS